ncbi:MAG: glycosyltransferase family 2 protein [Chitinophagaceae bacterium]|nr:glycosyltransferase family 2 protein [Chitinophagaceae bacterium]
MRICSVIVTYNGAEWIEKCLSSLRESTQPVHAIVIDNASQDDTVKIIREEFPEVELIASEKNLGFGQANNIGIKRALEERADYVLLLNQDAWIEASAIEKMMAVFHQNPGYGILSPYHHDYTGADTERYFKEWVLENYTPGLKEDLERNELKPVYPSRFVHAACWLMPLSTIERVGGFDPLFFHYGEDNDYVQRMQYHGLKTGIVPQALLYHQGTNEGLGSPEKKLWFQVNQAVTLFKDPKASTAGALALFARQFVRLQFSGNKVLAKAYRTNLRRIFEMLASRREQKKARAYLR